MSDDTIVELINTVSEKKRTAKGLVVVPTIGVYKYIKAKYFMDKEIEFTLERIELMKLKNIITVSQDADQ